MKFRHVDGQGVVEGAGDGEREGDSETEDIVLVEAETLSATAATIRQRRLRMMRRRATRALVVQIKSDLARSRPRQRDNYVAHTG